MKYVVVDLEMNPIASEYTKELAICTNEIIGIGTVILDEKYQEIGQFLTYVKPQYNEVITLKIRKLTGIRTELIELAHQFEEAIEMFFSWCGGIHDKIEICQWSTADLHQVTHEMKMNQYHPQEKDKVFLTNWTNFQQEYSHKLGVHYQLSLGKALMYIGGEFEGRQHDALYDARNTQSSHNREKRNSLPESIEKCDGCITSEEGKCISWGTFDFSNIIS